MPKVPYLPADLQEPRDAVAAIRARRGGELLLLDRMLLHSPPLASGWNALLDAVRSRLTLEPRLRELAICAVGALNGARYEIAQHAGPFRQAGGTDRQLEALRDCDRAAADTELFDSAERMVLRLAIVMTVDVQVPDELLIALRAVLETERQVVELVGVIATYNMVSRFLVALGIAPVTGSQA
jgi:alkylhydroperoxidase family enzyme